MGLLAYGAGASEGLDKYLERTLTEAALAEKQREADQENQYKNKSLEETSKLRQATEASLESQRQATREAQLRDDVRATAAMRQPGTEVDPSQAESEMKHGIPSDFFLKSSVPDKEAVAQGVPPALAQNDPNVNIFKWRGTNKEPAGYDHEQKTYKLTDPDMAKQIGHKVGDLIDADLDPRTDQILYRGVNVTKAVDHYEKPPGEVLVQSGPGYITRTDAIHTLKEGGTVPLPETSSTRTMQEGSQMLLPHVSELGNTAAELEKRGLFGPAMSRVRELAAKLGTTGSPEEVQAAFEQIGNVLSNDPQLSTDRLVGKFATELSLLASGAGRVHGGARGGGSIQMIEYMRSILKDSSTLPMFLGRLDGLDSYLQGYAKGPGGAGKDKTAAPAAAAPDLYDEYVKRTQPKQ